MCDDRALGNPPSSQSEDCAASSPTLNCILTSQYFLARCRTARLLPRTNAENIHPEKRVRIGRLKLLPVVEISERSRVRIALPEGCKGLGRQFEAEKLQSMLGKENLDLWQGVTVLQHIKKQIAAAAGAVEILQRDKALFDAVFDAENLLAARAIPPRSGDNRAARSARGRR